MQRVIKTISDGLNIPVVALFSDKVQEQVIYTLTPTTDNGVIKAYNLKLNIFAFSLARCEKIDTQIRKLLLGRSEIPTISGVLTIRQNGGGTLTSEVGVHRICYYDITLRSD